MKPVLLSGISHALLIGLWLVLAGGALVSCGSDSDTTAKTGENACLWSCDLGTKQFDTACSSGPASESACQKLAEDNCKTASAPVANSQYQAGCDCPSSGASGECKSAPAWYWGNACFVQCEGGTTKCSNLDYAIGIINNEADCQTAAQSMCNPFSDAGAAPQQVEFRVGCSCPDFGSAGECEAPPAWYQ